MLFIRSNMSLSLNRYLTMLNRAPSPTVYRCNADDNTFQCCKAPQTELLRAIRPSHIQRLLSRSISPRATAFPFAESLVRPDPPSDPFCFPSLGQIWFRHPGVSWQMLLSRQLRRRANIDLPVVLTWERLLFGQHMQVPEGETSSHLEIACAGEAGSRDCHRFCDFHVPEERNVGFAIRWSACTHAYQLDLSDDEPVPALVVAHESLQVR